MALHTPINLRQLHHVVLLAEEAHFGRAAERAFLSQSAFSRSIAALEDEAEMRLVDRGPGFLRLTAAGECLVARARRLLAGSADLARELKMLRSGDLGDIAAGAGPYSAVTLLAPTIAQLQSEHPSVRARVEIAQPQVLVEQLVNGKLDFCLTDLTDLPELAQCRIEPLGAAPGALFVRTEHPLAVRQQVTLAELRSAHFASVHMPLPVSRRLGKLLGSDANGCLPLAFQCNSALVLRDYALHHDAVVFASQDVFAMEVAAGRMQRLPVPELDRLGRRTPLRMELGMLWLQDRTPSAAAMQLAARMRERADKVLWPPARGGAQRSV